MRRSSAQRTSRSLTYTTARGPVPPPINRQLAARISDRVQTPEANAQLNLLLQYAQGLSYNPSREANSLEELARARFRYTNTYVPKVGELNTDPKMSTILQHEMQPLMKTIESACTCKDEPISAEAATLINLTGTHAIFFIR